MFDFTQHVGHLASRLRRLANAGATPQAEPIPDSAQVPNSAGGFAWAADHWVRPDRFLVLGAEGGTFYVGERPLTRENATAAQTCLTNDCARVAPCVVEVGEGGRAPRQVTKCQARDGWSHRDALVVERHAAIHAIRTMTPNDTAFYLAFGNVPSTGKRILLALDVSGSMAAPVHGLPFVACREASAAMALVTASVELSYHALAFTAGPHRSLHPGCPTGLSPLPLSPRERLDDVVRRTERLPFGGTDCALPVTEALKHRQAVDAFVIYTDNETWAGDVHPAQALRAYRERTGIAAKLVVVAMASNGFSIADPNDAGMLDVVGFDAATPQVVSEFIA